MFQPVPWTGGKWGVREAIDYMLTADWTILNLAATQREDYLFKAWSMAHANLEQGSKGKPFAYLVAVDPSLQHDPAAALEMLERLQRGGLEIRRASAQRAPARWPPRMHHPPALRLRPSAWAASSRPDRTAVWSDRSARS